jgi:hypothetical protein
MSGRLINVSIPVDKAAQLITGTGESRLARSCPRAAIVVADHGSHAISELEAAVLASLHFPKNPR